MRPSLQGDGMERLNGTMPDCGIPLFLPCIMGILDILDNRALEWCSCAVLYPFSDISILAMQSSHYLVYVILFLVLISLLFSLCFGFLGVHIYRVPGMARRRCTIPVFGIPLFHS